jgi:hypothetical protein
MGKRKLPSQPSEQSQAEREPYVIVRPRPDGSIEVERCGEWPELTYEQVRPLFDWVARQELDKDDAGESAGPANP